MNLKLLCSFFILISCARSISAHGHSHDGVHHHHSHEEDIKPSFKYSRQANEEVKYKEHIEEHNHHGHSHGEAHHHHHDEPMAKEVPAGYYNSYLFTMFFLIIPLPLF